MFQRLAAGCFFLFVFSAAVCAEERPNVLFIAVDDLNDWIGCLEGHPQALTPNIDRLANAGVLFTNAHCAAPACNPSRAAVFSGQMPTRTGVWSNDSAKLSAMQPQLMQLPQAFRSAGYVTLGTGKLSGDKRTKYDRAFTTEQRWSPFAGDQVKYTQDELPSKGTSDPRHLLNDSQGREVVLPLNRMPSDRRPNEVSGESFDWGPFDVPDTDFGDTQITAWAIKQIQGDLEKPFFLGVGYYRPHIPLFAPERFFERFERNAGLRPIVTESDLDDLPAQGKMWALEAITAGSHATVVKYDQWERAVEAYLACITYVDHEIGRLLDALESSSKADSTLVVLWSDHGWHLGEKQHWGKWTGWQRSTRVPLIVRPHKDFVTRWDCVGKQCNQSVNLVDLYPTLVELCGIKPPSHSFDGKSLVGRLQEPLKLSEEDRGSLSLFGQGNCSLIYGQWRIIRYANGDSELYNHEDDPNEWHNLAADAKYQRDVRRLSNQLDERLDEITPP